MLLSSLRAGTERGSRYENRRVLLRQPRLSDWEAWAELRRASREGVRRNGKRTQILGDYQASIKYFSRYFELAPKGFTSLEKHMHTHTIVCVRGEGVLLKGDERTPLKPFDVAYVDALEVHQLHNEQPDPFGFFCIVDHQRDRTHACRSFYAPLRQRGLRGRLSFR